MNGIIVVNKEKGYTSRDVVNVISNSLRTKKIGHTGTLDPIAEGVLVLCIGKCTKLCDYFTNNDKEYIAEFELFYETDTLDNTGTITNKKNIELTNKQIETCIKSFIGEYDQTVPIYSAVKIKGKKLYEYARNKIEVELPKRKVKIYNIEIISIDKSIKIKCLVSKGTYIRSLIRDIGYKLNTYATMTSLTRTKQGIFNINSSYKINDIQKNNYKLISIEEIFYKYPRININELEYKKISNGVILDNVYNSEYVLFYYDNRLISIYKEYEKSRIKPFIVF